MSDKPVMHGRDHRPGGMDPIPGLTLGHWAALYINYPAETVTIPGGIIGATDIALLHSATSDSNATVFSFESLTYIHLLKAGAYYAEVGLQWSDPATSQGIIQVANSLNAPPPLYGRTASATANQTNPSSVGASKDSSLFFFAPGDVGPGNKISLTADLTAATAKTAVVAYLRVVWIPVYWE